MCFFLICSILGDVVDVYRTVQGLRPGVLRAHEVDADEERLPLQVFRLPCKSHAI